MASLVPAGSGPSSELKDSESSKEICGVERQLGLRVQADAARIVGARPAALERDRLTAGEELSEPLDRSGGHGLVEEELDRRGRQDAGLTVAGLRVHQLGPWRAEIETESAAERRAVERSGRRRQLDPELGRRRQRARGGPKAQGAGADPTHDPRHGGRDPERRRRRISAFERSQRAVEDHANLAALFGLATRRGKDDPELPAVGRAAFRQIRRQRALGGRRRARLLQAGRQQHHERQRNQPSATSIQRTKHRDSQRRSSSATSVPMAKPRFCSGCKPLCVESTTHTRWTVRHARRRGQRPLSSVR